MLWVLAFHIIFMVTWFSGLFYLPRLYVYHAAADDSISNERFKLMEKKLFYYITTPGGILTTIFGVWLLSYNFAGYMQAGWVHWKLLCVVLLWFYHIYLGYLLQRFKTDNNRHSHTFYRIVNELPSLLLVAIVMLAVVKPL